MSKARITFKYNNDTGKRDIHIDYESDPSALPYEHEEEHRNIVRRVIDLKAIQKEEDIEVTRRQPKTEVRSADRQEKDRTKLQSRKKLRERK